MAASKVTGFFKRNQEDDTQGLTGNDKKECLTIGAAINYSIVIDFVAIFVACLIIVGSLGTLRHDISKSDGVNVTASCYMYASFGGGDGAPCTLDLVSARPCDGAMVGFSFIAIMAVAFVISLIVKAFLHHDLNWTLYIELPVLVISILLVFALAVTISIGNVTTCSAVKSYHGCRGEYKGCNGTFPNAKFHHGTRASIAQNTAWFVFLFIFIAIVLFVIRLGVFLKRRKKQAIQRTIDREGFSGEDEKDSEGPKPV